MDLRTSDFALIRNTVSWLFFRFFCLRFGWKCIVQIHVLGYVNHKYCLGHPVTLSVWGVPKFHVSECQHVRFSDDDAELRLHPRRFASFLWKGFYCSLLIKDVFSENANDWAKVINMLIILWWQAIRFLFGYLIHEFCFPIEFRIEFYI